MHRAGALRRELEPSQDSQVKSSCVDRQAIKAAAANWIEAVVEAQRDLAWLAEADLDAYPAFLTDAKAKEGDDYKAGAVPIVISADASQTEAAVDKLKRAVAAD